jgi:hypothetical protein
MQINNGMTIAEVLIFGLFGISILFASKINESMEHRARRRRERVPEKRPTDSTND